MYSISKNIIIIIIRKEKLERPEHSRRYRGVNFDRLCIVILTVFHVEESWEGPKRKRKISPAEEGEFAVVTPGRYGSVLHLNSGKEYNIYIQWANIGSIQLRHTKINANRLLKSSTIRVVWEMTKSFHY